MIQLQNIHKGVVSNIHLIFYVGKSGEQVPTCYLIINKQWLEYDSIEKRDADYNKLVRALG